MGLISGLKEKLEKTFIVRALAEIDRRGSAKWPAGWLKVKRALKGWKFLVGWLVMETPDISNWMTSSFPSVMHGLGLDGETAQVVKAVGATLMVIGVIHKYLKYTDPIERREDGRGDSSFKTFDSSQPVELHGDETIVAPKLSDLEQKVFLAEFNKRVNNGMDRDRARFEALDVIQKNRK